MGTVASQIASLNIVYSTVYSGVDQRKHQSSTSLAFVRGIHRGPGTEHKGMIQRFYSSFIKYFFAFIISPTHFKFSLRWRRNGRDGVSNHQPNDCLLNRLFRHRSKKTSKLRVTGLCAANSPVTGEFPAQRASYAENVSIWWRHHVKICTSLYMLYRYLFLYFRWTSMEKQVMWYLMIMGRVSITPWILSSTMGQILFL